GGGVAEGAERDATENAGETAAQAALGLRENVERAELRGLLSLLERDIAAELPNEPPLAVPLADLPGDEQEIAAACEWHIVRDRRRRLRQRQSQLLQSVFDLAGHARLLLRPPNEP